MAGPNTADARPPPKCTCGSTSTAFLPSFAVVDTAAHHDNRRARAVCAGVSPGQIVVFDKASVDFVEVSFEGGEVSSDGGLPLVRQMDARLELIKDLSRALPDDRHPSLITHSQEQLVRQRVLGLVQGYKDLNDHDSLRHDLLRQTTVNRDTPLASSPTLCRLEKRANRQSALAMHKVFLEKFIASF